MFGYSNAPIHPYFKCAYAPDTYSRGSPPPYISVEPSPPNQGGVPASPTPDPYVILGAQMHAHLMEIRQEIQGNEEVHIQNEAILAQGIAESKDFVVHKMEESLIGLSKQVYGMIEELSQKIPVERPAPVGETVDPATLSNLLQATSQDIKKEFETRSSTFEALTLSMFEKLTQAQLESTKEMTTNFQEMRKEIHARENAMRHDWKKTDDTLQNMQGAVNETLFAQVGELDTQKKNMALMQNEVSKMRKDTSEALHLLAKKMRELKFEGGDRLPLRPPRPYPNCGPRSTTGPISH